MAGMFTLVTGESSGFRSDSGPESEPEPEPELELECEPERSERGRS